jgi:hypothetical protein
LVKPIAATRAEVTFAEPRKPPADPADWTLGRRDAISPTPHKK